MLHQPDNNETSQGKINYRACPTCQSTYLDRIPRRIIDRISSLAISLKRYQCSSCGWRGNVKAKTP